MKVRLNVLAFLVWFFGSVAKPIVLRVRRLLSMLNALKAQVLARAYAIWSLRGILATKGVRRHGAATAFTTGFEIIVLIIFLVVAVYVAAFTLPGALTAMATSALTSVNTGIQTLFQVVVSLIAVVALVLLLIGAVRRAFI